MFLFLLSSLSYKSENLVRLRLQVNEQTSQNTEYCNSNNILKTLKRGLLL